MYMIKLYLNVFFHQDAGFILLHVGSIFQLLFYVRPSNVLEEWMNFYVSSVVD